MEKIHFFMLGESKQDFQMAQHLFSLFPIETECSLFENMASFNQAIIRTTGPIIIIVDLSCIKMKDHLATLEKEASFNNHPVIFFINDNQAAPFKMKENHTLLKRPLSKLHLATSFEEIIKQNFKHFNFHHPCTYNNQNFISLGIDVLLNISISPCDVYLHIGVHEKFLKVVNANDKNFQDIIEKYDRKGIHEFFILEDDYHKYALELFSQQVYSSLDNSDQKANVLEKQEILHNKLHNLGLDYELINKTSAMIKDLTQSLKNQSLRKLINFHQSKKFPFIYDHSYLTSIFATQIAENADWTNKTIVENICTASLFHDMGLNDVNLALQEHRGHITPENLSKEQKDELFNHPFVMANLLAKDPDIHSDVIKIVKNHHEGMGENSYPLKVPIHDLTGPTCAFILAHEFTLGLYKIGFNLDKVDKLLAQLRDKFPHKPFPLLIECLVKGLHYQN